MPLTPQSAAAADDWAEVATVAPRAAGARETEQRRRLRNAVVAEVARRGYSTATVSDVVRRARVSRSTFYELYDGKEDCFLDAYAALQQQLLKLVMAAAGAGNDVDPETLIVRGIDAYLNALFIDTRVHQAFQKEILVAGPAGARAWQQAFESWARLLHRRIGQAFADNPRIARGRALPSEPVIYAALVGMNALCVRAIDDGATEPSSRLRRDVMRVLVSMVSLDAEQECRWIEADLPMLATPPPRS